MTASISSSGRGWRTWLCDRLCLSQIAGVSILDLFPVHLKACITREPTDS
jgi:hypothetical protein